MNQRIHTGKIVFESLTKTVSKKVVHEIGINNTEKLIQVSTAAAMCDPQTIKADIAGMTRFAQLFLWNLAYLKMEQNLRTKIWSQRSLEKDIFLAYVMSALDSLNQSIDQATRLAVSQPDRFPITEAFIFHFCNRETAQKAYRAQPKTVLDLITACPEFYLNGIEPFLV